MNIDIPTGIAPTVQGDPAVALIAQVNRYQKKYKQPEFPLAPGAVPVAVAALALGILQARLMAAMIRLPDPGTASELQQIAAAAGSPLSYVQPRLVEVTRALALYADTIGLPPAKVGITSSIAVRQWGTFEWVAALSLAALGGVAGFIALRRARLLRAG